MKKLLQALTILLFSISAFAVTKEEVKSETKQAATAATEYSKEQKEQFQRDMEGKLDDLEVKIADLKKKAATKKGETKVKMNQQIVSLEKEKNEFRNDLDKLKQSSGEAWMDMKEGTRRAWDDLKASYEKTKTE